MEIDHTQIKITNHIVEHVQYFKIDYGNLLSDVDQHSSIIVELTHIADKPIAVLKFDGGSVDIMEAVSSSRELSQLTVKAIRDSSGLDLVITDPNFVFSDLWTAQVNLNGAVAQLEERRTGCTEVESSNLSSSTKSPFDFQTKCWGIFCGGAMFGILATNSFSPHGIAMYAMTLISLTVVIYRLRM